ncbi:MAG: DUF2075 domain-containing protein [Alphaproteobacteria bacterium]|nr:DUF2075 domain-containing protein [Alphaproteobacteria bacterium]
MRAWFESDVFAFLTNSPEQIANHLAAMQQRRNFSGFAVSIAAWEECVRTLQEALSDPSMSGWRVFFEYPLVRLGRRADIVLLTDRAIFVLEFKTAGAAAGLTACRQASDYAEDLHDFHAGSRGVPILPIAVGHSAALETPPLPLPSGVHPARSVTRELLGQLLFRTNQVLPPRQPALDAAWWSGQPYQPVPGIIEAARMAFAKQSVDAINATLADRGSLEVTARALVDHLSALQRKSEHGILFVTGIPGAGKTRVGLRVAFEESVQSIAVFLTGNPTLVHVFREALIRDAVDQGRSRAAATQAIEQRIQPLPYWRDHYAATAETPPEHVIVVDEAQRSWTAQQAIRKTRNRETKLTDSEPGHILDAMRRTTPWGAIICLVGGGQEIHDGEGGLLEWGEALRQRPDWQIFAADAAFRSSDIRQNLPADLTCTREAALHLREPMRSLRNPAVAEWVSAVLGDDLATAQRLARGPDWPVFLTRSLWDMREALRAMAQGYRRAGLLASSGAKRLRADGLGVELPHMDKSAVARWFLDFWPDDVRASDALEVVATEFSCQGLELDYTGLAWGGDLIRSSDNRWRVRRFRGTRWESVSQPEALSNQMNTYRVLLTRARYATIMWVPEGNAADRTRQPSEFDAVAEYLLACGARHLPAPTPMPQPALLL